MLETLAVFILGIAPPLFSLWVMRKAQVRARENLIRAREIPVVRIPGRTPFTGDLRYVEGIGEVTGDPTCQFNARSAYIRCAVNPSGPCRDCPHYRSRNSEAKSKF
jgi:hypothetical protein